MEYALSYANQGYSVFPLQPNGKQPLTQHGFKEASRDPETIRQWWTKWPDANVGIVTGKISGVIVLDVDRKHGVDGVVSMAELDIPKTLTIRTPSGGFHLFFKAPAGTIVPRRIGVKPGLDVLGEGGYVVAAGSWINGGAYEIARNLPIAECPEVLINLAQRAVVREEPVKDEAGKIAAGGRNNYLTTVGGKLRRIGFAVDELSAALLSINSSRLNPPMPEAEVRRIASSVARYEPDGRSAEEAEQPTSITVKPITELLAATYPPVEYISEPILTHPSLTLLYGPSGISKTYFILAWALAIASGQNFLKWKTEKPRGVLYIDGELGGRTMQQRIRMLQAGHEFTYKAPFYVACFDDQGSGLFPNLEDPLSQLRYLNGIPDDVQFVVIDSLSTLAAMEESNDYKSWGTIQRFLLGLKRRGISVIVVHHANKGGTEQSGTARRVHVMDSVLSLRAHTPADGAAPGYKDVEVHVTKGRNLPPEMQEPFIATLSSPFHQKDMLAWSSGELGARKIEQIEELLKTGMPVAAVIQELGCASSFAYRVRKRLEESGDLKQHRAKAGRKARSFSND
jgi:hypothetical protein